MRIRRCAARATSDVLSCSQRVCLLTMNSGYRFCKLKKSLLLSNIRQVTAYFLTAPFYEKIKVFTRQYTQSYPFSAGVAERTNPTEPLDSLESICGRLETCCIVRYTWVRIPTPALLIFLFGIGID
jgi:hypothetical protein